MAERGTGTGHEDGPEPFDEEAAWAAIVAGYGDEPEFPGDDPPAREPAPGPGALPGFLETEKPLKPFPAGAEPEPGTPARGGADREPVRRESGPAGDGAAGYGRGGGGVRGGGRGLRLRGPLRCHRPARAPGLLRLRLRAGGRGGPAAGVERRLPGRHGPPGLEPA
ncbi:hypothetical protein [Streptomyces fradiae]|uniref:hypothetical protein n=1 Tax=Streptomyces fradiae TaxID=1906 RepID=UPI0008734240|nr:hypothetical protein [Streptomyces fradiae]OFA44392.1 hypothetical protein BEN35_22300 [Streptomyces fradiae]